MDLVGHGYVLDAVSLVEQPQGVEQYGSDHLTWRDQGSHRYIHMYIHTHTHTHTHTGKHLQCVWYTRYDSQPVPVSLSTVEWIM